MSTLVQVATIPEVEEGRDSSKLLQAIEGNVFLCPNHTRRNQKYVCVAVKN